MAGSDILGTEEEHKNMKFVDSSFWYDAYTLFISGNMWYETNILQIHSNEMATLKKNL